MSRGATARLFVALDPPVEVAEALSGWARTVAAASRGWRAGAAPGELRALEPEALHLTLCFLGSRPVEEIDAFAAALARCSEHRCELTVGAPVWLPPRDPRILAVEIGEPSGELERMQRELSRALSQETGWEAERRRFRPHVTVARVRGGGHSGGHGRGRGRRGGRDAPHAPEPPAAMLPATPALSFTPEAVTLFRSSLLPSGARYEVLASSALTPPDRATLAAKVPSAARSSLRDPLRPEEQSPCP